MHIFLYEWITGGGLVEETSLPASLLAEGSAMIAALAADFSRMAGQRVTVLRDMRLDDLPFPGCDVVEIDSLETWRYEFDRLAAAADRTMVVAPEFDHILGSALRRLASAGNPSLNSSDELVALASDKHRTAMHLAAGGVAVPEARLLDADEARLPADFTYPAVLKPLDGAGSQHTLLVHGAGDEPPPYPWPRRLERFVPGRAASVAALCGPGVRTLLPPCWQRLSEDGRFTYRGGAIIRENSLAARATRLAERALAALPTANGYVGVDLILGNDVRGREDVVLEINPRLTTSYVGLRAALRENIAEALLRACDGQRVELTLDDPDVAFTAAGDVWQLS